MTAIPPLGVYLEKKKSGQKDTCIPMFVVEMPTDI